MEKLSFFLSFYMPSPLHNENSWSAVLVWAVSTSHCVFVQQKGVFLRNNPPTQSAVSSHTLMHSCSVESGNRSMLCSIQSKSELNEKKLQYTVIKHDIIINYDLSWIMINTLNIFFFISFINHCLLSVSIWWHTVIVFKVKCGRKGTHQDLFSLMCTTNSVNAFARVIRIMVQVEISFKLAVFYLRLNITHN